MSTYRPLITALPVKFSVLAILSCVATGCAENGQQLARTKALAEPASQGVSVLALASNDSARLEAPWAAQDANLLETIGLRSPKLSPAARLVTETSFPCSDGGSVTRTVDNQGPPWFSAGDSYTTTFAECIEGGTLTNGARSFSVDAMVGQPYIDASWTMTTTMARQNLVKTDIASGQSSSADGFVTTALDATQDPNNQNWYAYVQKTTGSWTRTRPNNGTEVTSSGSVEVSFAWSDDPASRYQWDFDVSADSSLFGSTKAKTLATLEGNANMPPDTGKLVIEKVDTADLTTVTTVTALADGMALEEVDIDGDGVIDSTQTIPWNQLVLQPVVFQQFY